MIVIDRVVWGDIIKRVYYIRFLDPRFHGDDKLILLSMSKISSALLSQLRAVGLSANEATVYSSLLGLGMTTTGPIIKKTGLHGQLVYQALENLLERNLTSFIFKRGRKYFQAASPASLLDNVRKMENVAQALIPRLKDLQKDGADRLQVKILYGHEGFINNLQEVVESAARYDKIVRVIGGAAAKDFYRVIGDWYPNYVELLARKKVSKWQISPENTATEFKDKFAREKNTVLKIMPPDFSSLTQTVIIQIWNKAIAASYRTHFEYLWKQGKKYAPKRLLTSYK